MYINTKHIIFLLVGINILLILYILFSKKQPIVVNVNNGTVPNQNKSNSFSPNSPAYQPSQCNGRQANSELPTSQSDFFTKSIQFATDYLKSNSDFDIHSVPESAQKVLNSTKILSEQVKQNIITAMNYFSVDVINANQTENNFRAMSTNEKIPLWIIIMREAIVKVVPDLNVKSETFNPNFVEAKNPNMKVVA